MGQGRSRDTAYVAPEMLQQPMRKAGSLTSLSFGRARKSGGVRRSRSFRENKEVQEALLRLRIESEMKDLQRWVNERPKKHAMDGVIPPKLVDLAAVTVAQNLRGPADVDGLPVTRELKDVVEFRLLPTFDEKNADPKTIFTDRGRNAQYTGKGYSTTVMKTPSGRGLRHGRHAWIIYVDTSRVQGWMQIGVVNQKRMDTECSTAWDGNPHPFRKGEIARRSNGNFHSGRNELEATMVQETIFLSGYGAGDTIGMKVDFDARELYWLKNGEPYGSRVSFDEDTVFHPSVSLDSPGETVSIVYYSGPIAI
ncbi:hypothetical protein GBAR_LOCUS12896 [Geodia barretti]|uniref:B30.2/SPRY domain-containing protein n=1 Tax=Geodia barretti TaxID=519541 RepID=A0AA35WIR4_GEOBA|nr:hypothetical protein GBAR_LOCUS12896 [Geodia barretti]